MAKDKEKDPAKSPKGDRGAAKKEEQATNAIGNVSKREIVDELKESYIDYAMSVIVARALPDVRDGLKPVHRKILYTMNEMGLNASAKFRKSATVVGECFVKDTLILSKIFRLGMRCIPKRACRKLCKLMKCQKNLY